MIVVPQRSLSRNEAFSCLLVSMNIINTYDHELFNTENVDYLALFVVEPLHERFNYIISSVDDWRLCVLWISANNHVAKT